MLKKIVSTLFLWILFFISFFNYSYTDSLDDVYENAKEDYQLVQEVDDWQIQWWVKKTMKVMLKIAIMVWVAVFLYWGIRFLLSMWDDSKAKKVRDTLIVSGIWLIIAFGAWAILQVILSVWTTIRV